MSWKFDEKSPLYLQIARHVMLQIISHEIESGEQLPTVRDYAEVAGVNPNTMQRAFLELERQGMVFSQRTSGRFVTEDTDLIAQKRHEFAKSELQSFIENIKKIGYKENEIPLIVEEFIKETEKND